MALLEDVITILGDSMEMGERTSQLTAGTTLFGGLPEFDSMALVIVMTSLEERYDIMIDEDEIDENTFETVGSLVTFMEQKLA